MAITDDCNCIICHDIFALPITLQCGHTFCYECLHTSYHVHNNTNCPMCRNQISTLPTNSNVILKKQIDRYFTSNEITEEEKQDYQQRIQNGETLMREYQTQRERRRRRRNHQMPTLFHHISHIIQVPELVLSSSEDEEMGNQMDVSIEIENHTMALDNSAFSALFSAPIGPPPPRPPPSPSTTSNSNANIDIRTQIEQNPHPQDLLQSRTQLNSNANMEQDEGIQQEDLFTQTQALQEQSTNQLSQMRSPLTSSNISNSNRNTDTRRENGHMNLRDFFAQTQAFETQTTNQLNHTRNQPEPRPNAFSTSRNEIEQRILALQTEYENLVSRQNPVSTTINSTASETQLAEEMKLNQNLLRRVELLIEIRREQENLANLLNEEEARLNREYQNLRSNFEERSRRFQQRRRRRRLMVNVFPRRFQERGRIQRRIDLNHPQESRNISATIVMQAPRINPTRSQSQNQSNRSQRNDDFNRILSNMMEEVSEEIRQHDEQVNQEQSQQNPQTQPQQNQQQQSQVQSQQQESQNSQRHRTRRIFFNGTQRTTQNVSNQAIPMSSNYIFVPSGQQQLQQTPIGDISNLTSLFRMISNQENQNQTQGHNIANENDQQNDTTADNDQENNASNTNDQENGAPPENNQENDQDCFIQ